MESHCVLTRSQTKLNKGEDKLKTHQTPDKTGACQVLVKKIESIKKNILTASSERKLKRKTSSPKENMASDLFASKPSDKISSKHDSTTEETTNTMKNVTDKVAELSEISINQPTEVMNIPKKRKWIKENEGNISDIFEESKTSDNRIDAVNNEDFLKNKPYILLTPVKELTESLSGTDTSFEKNSMTQNDDSKNKACDSGKESVHSCEELENSSIPGLSEPPVSITPCTPYNLRHKKDKFAIQKSCVNSFESKLENNLVTHEETDSDFNNLHEECVTRNSVKRKCLRDKIESKEIKIIENNSLIEHETEKTGEDITRQNQFEVDLGKYGIGSVDEEKTENLIDSIQITNSNQTFETESSENTKHRELTGSNLHEERVTRNSVKRKCLRDKIESKEIKIIENNSLIEHETEKTGEDITRQNQFEVDLGKYGIVSVDEEKTENLIDSIQITNSNQTFEAESSENTKHRELTGSVHIIENHQKLGFTQEKLLGVVSVIDTYKKYVSESCEDKKKEPDDADGHRNSVVASHKEENQERLVSDIQLLGSHRKILIELSETKKQENSQSLSENIVNAKDRDGDSRKSISQNQLLSEDSGHSLLESDFQKLQKEKLHSENKICISTDDLKQEKVSTEVRRSGIRDIAACDVENSETSKLLNETNYEMQNTQSLSGEGYKRNNEQNYSLVKLPNLNTDDSASPSKIQTSTAWISLLDKKHIQNSEEGSSSINFPTNIVQHESVETLSSTDNVKSSVSNKDYKNSEAASNAELQLRNTDMESQLHTNDCSNKQVILESDSTCNQICYSLTEQESSADDNRKYDKNKKTEAGKKNKCCLEKRETVQVNRASAVREQKHISLCEDSSENISVKSKSVTESNEISNESQHIMDSSLSFESNQWLSDHSKKTVCEEQTGLLKASFHKTDSNLKVKKKKLNPVDLDKVVASNNVSNKVVCRGMHTKLSCNCSGDGGGDVGTGVVIIEENEGVPCKQCSKLLYKPKQSNDNSHFIEERLSQTSVGHENLHLHVKQAQEKNCLSEIYSECSKTENVFQKPINESVRSFQTSENLMPCVHHDYNKFFNSKTICSCHKGCIFNCACNKKQSNHFNDYKNSENIIESCVIPSVVSTIHNYFDTAGLNVKHVQTLEEQVQKNIKSVIENIHHKSKMHVVSDTQFINKKQKNKKKKNKRKKKNKNMYHKEGENQYLKDIKEWNKFKGNLIKGMENNQHIEHKRKKIKLKHEINKDTKARSEQIKNTVSDQIFKSVPHDMLRLSGKEKIQSARSKQMSGGINPRGVSSGIDQDVTQEDICRIKRKRYADEQLRPVKVMKLEKKITSGKNVFSVCRSENTSKDKNGKNCAESQKKVRKIKRKFRIKTVNVHKDNHGSYRQPTFQKDSSFTVCGSNTVRKDTKKPEYTEGLKKVNEAQHKFTDKTINIPKDKHASSCKLMMSQKNRDFPVCGSNNKMDKTDKMETNKDVEQKHKFNVKTGNEIEGKLKSSCGEFTFQLGNKTAYEKSILEPIRPHANKSKEYISALQEMKQSQELTAGLNIFNASKKSKIARDKTVSNKGTSSTNVENRESPVKRLPEELLEAVSQNVVEKKTNKSTQGFSELHLKYPKHKKKLKLKSAVLEDGYIPLNTNSATQFIVARLDKKPTLSAAKKAEQFKQNCLYGPHIKRAPVKREYIKQKLCQADDHS